MSLYNLFFPHKETHKKAHLISWHALGIYILLFVLLQITFSYIGIIKPGILGISSNVDQKEIITLTNMERQKLGLKPLMENEALNKAAKLKGLNMFDENYWAHFAPSGKSPWDFILGAGYKFTFAGENLAKNFYQSDDAVLAWMKSKTHKENILNPKYDEIGIALVEGVLNGQKTTLIVQMFGTTKDTSQLAHVNVAGKQFNVSKKDYESKPQILFAADNTPSPKALFDPFLVSKSLSMVLLILLILLLSVDFVVLKRRGVLRLTSHHFASITFLSAAAFSIISSSSGSIL